MRISSAVDQLRRLGNREKKIGNRNMSNWKRYWLCSIIIELSNSLGRLINYHKIIRNVNSHLPLRSLNHLNHFSNLPWDWLVLLVMILHRHQILPLDHHGFPTGTLSLGPGIGIRNSMETSDSNPTTKENRYSMLFWVTDSVEPPNHHIKRLNWSLYYHIILIENSIDLRKWWEQLGLRIEILSHCRI